jgi:hypothetical protein
MTKPCPFCRSTDIGTSFREQATVGGKSVLMHYRFCEDCHCQGPEGLSEARATTLWDRRALVD